VTQAAEPLDMPWVELCHVLNGRAAFSAEMPLRIEVRLWMAGCAWRRWMALSKNNLLLSFSLRA
jgi:hypothetical protein